MIKTHRPSIRDTQLLTETQRRSIRMQSGSASSSSSRMDTLSILAGYADTLSDQPIQPDDIKWALDLPCAPPVLDFLAKLIVAENDGTPERTTGLEKEERDIWDRAVQGGLVNTEPSEEAAQNLSEPYLTPSQLKELTAYNERLIKSKDQRLRRVLSRIQILQETHDQVLTETNESKTLCARLGEKIRDVEAFLLEFSVKMNHTLLPQLAAQFSASSDPVSLQDQVEHLVDILSTNLPIPPSLPSFRSSISKLSPESLEEEVLRLSESMRSLLQREDVSKEPSNSRKEKLWEREMDEVLKQMDEGNFGSDDEDDYEWEAEDQEPRQKDRKPMKLIKDLIEGAWEWDMIDKLEISIEKARKAKTMLTDVQLPVLLLLCTKLQAESEETLDSLAIWQAVHSEMESLKSRKIASNSRESTSEAPSSSRLEEGHVWEESIRTILRSHLTTSIPSSIGKTAHIASFSDVLNYLHSLQAQVCLLKVQTDEELDKLIRGEALKSQRALSVVLSSRAPTPLHPPLKPPTEIQQAKNDIQGMMKTLEGLVREWILLGDSLGKDKEGKKQITRFVGENVNVT